MNESSYIKRNDPENPETDFLFLKKKGIEFIQKLGGKVWTDYNIHDPGITILEQVCYAITELMYITDLDIKDYLARSNDEPIPLKEYGLYTPKEIFPSQAITIKDYRKVIFDKVDEIINVIIEKNSDLAGLYNIKIEPKRKYLKSEKALNFIIKKVEKIYLEHRNLCEDINQVSILKNKFVEVSAEIEVNNKQTPENILAEIFFEIMLYITPGITFQSFSELIAKGYNFEKLLSGPDTKNGYIDFNQLLPQKKILLISEIIQRINKIKGVGSIKDICFIMEGEKYQSQIKFEDKDEVARMEDLPENLSELKINLFKDGRKHKIDIEIVKKEFAKKLSLYNAIKTSGQNLKYLIELPFGKKRNLDEYHSIQNHFPNIYGINKFGIPGSETDARKAQAKQLKGYLIFFEQLLSDFLVQQENIKNIFSVKQSIKNTYYAKKLINIPNSKGLMKSVLSADVKLVKNITETIREFIELKNFVLREFTDKLSVLLTDSLIDEIVYLLSLYPEDRKIFDLHILPDLNLILEKYLETDNQLMKQITKDIKYVFGIYFVDNPIEKHSIKTKLEFKFDNIKLVNQEKFKKLLNKLCDCLKSAYNIKPRKKELEIQVSEILQDAQPHSIKNIIKNYDNFYDRRNRLLDYLLALYGESFQQKSLKRFNYYYKDYEFQQVIIDNKLLFLKNIVNINRNRAMGFNYSKNPMDKLNISVLKLKASILLGIKTHQHILYSNVFTKYNIKLVSDFEKLKCSDCIYRSDYENIYLDQHYVDDKFYHIPPDDSGSELEYDNIEEVLKEINILKGKIIHEEFFRYGFNRDKFRIGRLKNSIKYIVVFRVNKDDDWLFVSSFTDYNNAIRIMNNMFRFIKKLNIESEGMHFIEHILLRHNKSREKYKINIYDRNGDVFLKSINSVKEKDLKLMQKSIVSILSNSDSYQIMKIDDDKHSVFLLTDGEYTIIGKETFVRKEDAERYIYDFCYYVKCLEADANLDICIGVETDYDEPEKITNSFFSNRMTVVLPSWTSRFHNKKFRMLVEETISINAPAHIYIDYLWLEPLEMQNFELLLSSWLNEKKKNRTADNSSNKLLNYLTEKINYQENEFE